jgi:hypothetical protein
MNMTLFDTAAAHAINPPPLGLVVDNFAGGGGASTGIEAALVAANAPSMAAQLELPGDGEAVAA